MNARLIKETRDLLPIFAGTLLVIVVPCLIWHRSAGDLGYVAFGLACAVLGGCSFGNEFQHRTLTLLLSQPIPRSVLWREKMLVLGGGMLVSLMALLVCLQVCCPAGDRPGWPWLVLIPLCAFCGAPYWTLLLRHGIGGMAFAAAIPGLLMAVGVIVPDRLFHINTVEHSSVLVFILLSLIAIYCAVVFRLGYAKFKRLQVVDGPSRELGLPAGLEAFLVRPLTRTSAHFHSPFATLLKKEFRVQQTSFLLAGLFVLVAVAGAGLVKYHRDFAVAIVGADFFIYVLILPLIAGATSLAEEKGWGIAEWHLTLPPSAFKQWSAKMLAALSTSLALGLLLPTALFLAAAPLFDHPGAGDSLPPGPEVLGWILGSLLLTSGAIFAASVSNSTLRAILAAFAIIVAGCGVCALVGTGVAKMEPRLQRILMYIPQVTKALIPLLLTGGLFVMLCMVQWFAWSNFRRYGMSARRVAIQLLIIFYALGLVALAIVLAILSAASHF